MDDTDLEYSYKFINLISCLYLPFISGSFSKNVHFSVRDYFFILPSAFDVIYFS